MFRRRENASMNEIKEIKTNYGIYYVVPVAVTRELLDMKDECDYIGQGKIALKVLKEKGLKGISEREVYIRFFEFSISRFPSQAEAVWFKYNAKKYGY